MSVTAWPGGVAQAASCVDRPSNLTSWWPADSDGTDLIGNNPASLIGMGFAPGAVSQAFILDGVDDYAGVVDHPSLRPDSAISIEAWVRVDSYPNATQGDSFILAKSGPTGLQGYELGIQRPVGGLSAGAARLTFYTLSASVDIRDDLDLVDGRFHHLVGTYDGSEAALFVDGALRRSQALSGTLDHATTPLYVGVRSHSFHTPFHGSIDEIRIYSGDLSPCESRAFFLAAGLGMCAGDKDSDSIADYIDNCPDTGNMGQADADLDGVGDACDCAPGDAGALRPPGEVCDLRIADVGDQSELTWHTVKPASGTSSSYDVGRGSLAELPAGAGGSELCLASSTGPEAASDTSLPTPGHGYWYLVRARNACGIGTYGSRSSGAERVTNACP